MNKKYLKNLSNREIFNWISHFSMFLNLCITKHQNPKTKIHKERIFNYYLMVVCPEPTQKELLKEKVGQFKTKEENLFLKFLILELGCDLLEELFDSIVWNLQILGVYHISEYVDVRTYAKLQSYRNFNSPEELRLHMIVLTKETELLLNHWEKQLRILLYIFLRHELLSFTVSKDKFKISRSYLEFSKTTFEKIILNKTLHKLPIDKKISYKLQSLCEECLLYQKIIKEIGVYHES